MGKGDSHVRTMGHRTVALGLLAAVWATTSDGAMVDEQQERRVDALLAKMTLAEKIGQMSQRSGGSGREEAVRAGEVGSILNEVDVELINRLQRIAVTESRLGIPLLIGRDVIHGFRTIFPIPLGIAATWNPELAEAGARIAAVEAASSGVRWTFAPMMDVSRDARWGRIAESFGEDPHLGVEFSLAFIRGFQTDDLSRPDAVAACAKHFAGYGASESGRDYNLVNLCEPLLRNVYLPPFEAAVDAGVATFMAGFHELNGVPASGNEYLLRTILRDEWGFAGLRGQ